MEPWSTYVFWGAALAVFEHEHAVPVRGAAFRSDFKPMAEWLPMFDAPVLRFRLMVQFSGCVHPEIIQLS
jgi:hypothetical protein